MNLMDKVDRAVVLITEMVERFQTPVVMSSFGKDSMAMLHLIKMAGHKFPILHFKEPFYPEKYKFANEVILGEGYTVYDYPPKRTAVVKKGNTFELANFYKIHERELYLPTGIVESQSGLCGLSDLYYKPKGSSSFPWDLVFIGHKSSDIDPIFGSVPLKAQDFEADGVMFAFPLKDFDDVDIWKFTERYGVPYSSERYDKTKGYKEFENKGKNPDYFPVCVNCMDRDRPSRVHCPKLGYKIPNVSSLVDYVEVKLPSYVGGK